MKPTVALFVADPECSIQSSNGVIAALQDHYRFKLFGKNPLEKNFFTNVDLVAVPGGLGDASSFYKLFQHNGQRVKDFVKQGGGYLGICMGAYWAGNHYFKILDGIDAKQYIRRPKTDTHRPHAKAQQVMWKGREERMFFYDGCAIVGPKVDSCEIWSLYPNGDPMAVIQNRIGLIGCHPESEHFWYDSYSWMGEHWHNGRHHRLLLEFVKHLVNK